jgi:amidophosphoribosyltransferase
VVGIKRPHGFRPLCLGRLNGNWVLASETCALDLVQAEFVREIEPGEIVIIDADGPRSSTCRKPAGAPSAFSNSSISRGRTALFMGRNVYQMRKAMAAGWPRRHLCRPTW